MSEKKEKMFYTMGEVAEMFDVNQSLIRFWEQRFDILKPKKNKKGNRLFTPADIKNLEIIYYLVKEKGMTLAGAEKRLKENREGVERDTEVVKRLMDIKSILLEIKEELKDEEQAIEKTEENIQVFRISETPSIEEDISEKFEQIDQWGEEVHALWQEEVFATKEDSIQDDHIKEIVAEENIIEETEEKEEEEEEDYDDEIEDYEIIKNPFNENVAEEIAEQPEVQATIEEDVHEKPAVTQQSLF